MSLRALLGLGNATRVAGEKIRIKPLTVRQSLIIEQCFSPVADDIVARGVDRLEVYADHADDLLRIVAAACDKPLSWVENIHRDEFNALLAQLLEVERDFLNALVLQAAARANKAKQTKSTGQKSSKH